MKALTVITIIALALAVGYLENQLLESQAQVSKLNKQLDLAVAEVVDYSIILANNNLLPEATND